MFSFQIITVIITVILLVLVLLPIPLLDLDPLLILILVLCLCGMKEGDGSKTRWVVSGALALAFVWRADVLTTRMIVGGIVSAIGVKIVKRLLKQPRPPGASLTDGGMPSSHAQSLFFFATFLSAHCWSTEWWPIVSSVLLMSMALWQSARRVSKGLHTKEQIAVGMLMGIANALIWFHFLGPLCIPFIPDLFQSMIWRSTAVSVVLLVGLLTVSSVERWLRSRLYSPLSRSPS